MKNEIHHIDEYFSEGLAHIEFEPPVDVWENIEKELDRRHRTRLITIWTSMAAGLALFLSLGIYVFNSYKTDNQNIILASKQHTQNLNTASKTDAKGTQQYNVEKSTVPTQSNSNTKKTNNNNGQHPDNAKEADNKYVIDNKGAENSSSEVVVPSKDDTNDIITDDPFTNESNFIIAETAQPDTNQVIPQEVNNTPNNTNKPTNNNLVSTIEVVNPLLEYGKTEDQDKSKTNTWSLEGQVAPQYSYRNISEIKGYEPSKDIYNDSEDGLLAYGGGFKVNYQTGKRLSFQAGVYYSVMGQTMNNVYEVKEPAGMNTYATDQQKAYFINNSSFGPITTPEQPTSDVQNNTVSATTSYSSVVISNPTQGFLKEVSARQSTLLDDAQIIQQLKFIEVPFTARYQLINKKIGCHVIGGLSTNILVNSNVWLKQNGSKEFIGETDNLQRINYSSLVGLGIDYQWFKNISLSIEPTYKYYLNSISINENVKVHPYSFGIFTGLIYRF